MPRWLHRTSAVMPTVAARLEQLKASELRDVARQSGVLCSGNKSVLRERLTAHMTRVAREGMPMSIVSFDLGYRNLAYVHYDHGGRILAWNKVDLALPAFHPSVMAPVVRGFVHSHIQPLMDEAGAVVVEQQRARTGGGIGVFEHTLRVNCVEALLWASLLELTTTTNAKDVVLECVPRQNVDRHWPTLTGPTKKREGTRLVQSWLQDGIVGCSPALLAMFTQQKKQDDLSDCVIQSMTWYQWRRFALDWIE